MKKVFALFAVAGMLFTASCGNKEVSDESTEVEVVIEETPEVYQDSTEEVLEDSTENVEVVVEG